MNRGDWEDVEGVLAVVMDLPVTERSAALRNYAATVQNFAQRRNR